MDDKHQELLKTAAKWDRAGYPYMRELYQQMARGYSRNQCRYKASGQKKTEQTGNMRRKPMMKKDMS